MPQNATHPPIHGCFDQSYLSFITTNPTKSYWVNNVFACIANAMFTISGTILNSLVLVVFAKSAKLRADMGYYLIFVMSICDLATSLCVHPFLIVTSILELTQDSDCTVTTIAVITFAAMAGISLLTSLVMNLERYVAILHPFSYKSLVTRKRLLFAVVTLTLCWFLLIALPFVDIKIQSFAYVVTIMVFCLIVSCLYLRIFNLARKMPPVVSPTTQTSRNNINSSLVNIPEHQRAVITKLLTDLKLAKTYVIILMCYFCCYLPDAVFLFVNQFDKQFSQTVKARVIETWVFTLVAATSTFNSVVFFWRNTQLRREAVRIFKKPISRST